MEIGVFYQGRNGAWIHAGCLDMENGLEFSDHNIALTVNCKTDSPGITAYHLRFRAEYPTRVKLEGRMDGASPWHLIPCCIHGDNNLHMARPGQYPNLTRDYPEAIYSSPLWEFRADRASHPVSILLTSSGLGGISIDPYSENETRNGVFCALPDRFGVTLGYANLPFTFANKFCDNDDGRRVSTSDPVAAASASGFVFDFPGTGREGVRHIIDRLYLQYRELPRFRKSFHEAAQAVLSAFVEQNWSEDFKHYTNQEAHPPLRPELKPWRALLEIGWTGGSILAYPFIQAMDVLGLPGNFFSGRKDGVDLFNEIIAAYNPASGMFYDLVRPLNGSRVNGWWDFLKITHDCHSAYTNGHALYYLFMSMIHMRAQGREVSTGWLDTAVRVADTHLKLQREDGCFGYAFSVEKPQVTDFDGYAGCWIAAAIAAAGKFTGNADYVSAASRAAEYYHHAVRDLNVTGTPMDTWKAPDQEGNLAFMKLTRLLHELSGEKRFLDMLEDAAHYEYLWRYGFKAIPEIMPLKGSNWNSCGGSVTSVSNPHIHPMGVIVTPELYYLCQQNRGDVHRKRAEDGMAWIMNCLELYPEVTGYGRYGVTTERYCPSDGLTCYHYSDGRPSSMWYSYNGWAAANTLEALLWMVEHRSEFSNKPEGE